MSKVKMRCITCGKWFQSANAKEVTCPDCTQKARKEKLAAKNAPPNIGNPIGASGQNVSASARPVPPKPKSTQSGTNQWLDSLSDVKVGQPDPPPVRPKLPSPPPQRERRESPGEYQGPTGLREDRGPGYREGGRGPAGYREDRGPGPYRVVGGSGLAGLQGPRPRQPLEAGPGRGPRPDKNAGKPYDGQRSAQKYKPKSVAPKPATPPKPRREKTPPPQPFVPTPEQVTQIEQRYLELAQPTEFDGIRTQISKELGIPKKAVKKVIKELRDRQNIPSWWETQTYKGPSDELEKIKALYEPLLPVPPVGVHKTIAEQLSLKPGDVYQAIKAIRQEMNLPQYNDPVLHGESTQTTQTHASDTSAQGPAEPVGEPVSIADTAKEPAE